MTNPLRKLWRTPRPGPAESSSARPVGNELLLSDRRIAKRHSDPLPARVSYGIAASEEPVGIYNFSDKGLCFHGAVRYPIGAGLEITTTLPRTRLFGGSKVRYSARVVRAAMQRGEFITAVAIYGCQTLPTEQPENAGENSKDARVSHDELRSSPGSVSSELGTHKAQPRRSRRFSRYDCPASTVQFRNAATGEIASGELINLSLSGCYLRTASTYAPGAELELAVQAGRTRIHAHGRVKTVKENRGMAVEFIGELPQRLQRLPRFVQLIAAGRGHQNN
jgi:hypothetical protein